jgi:site-specific DNA recombinase
MKTAVLYARFSSDLQKDRSIDDQLAICRDLAKREEIKVGPSFADRAKSGASLFERDGLLELMAAAKRREFNVLIVESLDRLSRDQEDLAGLFKRLNYYEVEIRTVNEGVATQMHIGIRGLLGSMFLKDLGDKVRRGHNGRVREGKFPGAVTYGYRKVLGKPGEREIDPEQAAIVRRIFTEYAEGCSPRDIAAWLTRDCIPTPTGNKIWNHQTFVGGRLKRGMISNPIYIGEIVWNTSRTVLNPETGKKTKRAGVAEDRVTRAVPHLRIIEQPLWDAANKVRKDRAIVKF